MTTRGLLILSLAKLRAERFIAGKANLQLAIRRSDMHAAASVEAADAECEAIDAFLARHLFTEEVKP